MYRPHPSTFSISVGYTELSSIPNKPLVSDSMHLLSLFKSFQDDVRLHLRGGLVPVLIAGMLIWWDSLCASNPDIKELSCSLANNYANPRFGIIRVTMRALTSSTIDYHSDCRDSLMLNVFPPYQPQPSLLLAAFATTHQCCVRC